MSSILDNGAVVSTMAYGALLLDLAVVWFLLHPRTRTAAFVVVTAFHLTNAWLFGLFIFPWLMIAATTIFFPPDWPVRLRDRWLADPVRSSPTPPPPPRARSRPAPPWLIGTGCALWIAVQVAVPLRHYAISGNPSWTEQGHQFAWHMRLRHKEGNVTFVVTKGPDTWQVHPRDHLGAKQTHRLAGHPERLVHFARHLSDLYDGAEVRAMTSVSLNGRRPQPLVDPAVDLASVSLPRWGAPWILPLTEPPP